MGATGMLWTLLLVSSCCAYPQYGGGQQSEPEPVATQQEQLPDQLKEQLQQFWWQNQNVFNGEGTGGTVVVVQEQNPQPEAQIPAEIASPFIPTPSPDCDALHGCIPWQYCVNGVFTNTGEGLLALRTPSKVPETYTQKLCGQIGNICCRIPDSLLAAQQQGQTGGTGPYGSGSIGGEIIEVVSTGGVEPVVVETSGGGILTGGEVVEVVGTGGGTPGSTVTIVEQVSGGAGDEYGGTPGAANVDGSGVTGGNQQQTAGTVEIIETTTNECPAYTHDCVPYFQCVDDVIITDGAGLIDIRITPKRECTNPEYPDIPGQCCRIPGATPPPPTTVAPVLTCSGSQICVAESQCNNGGTVNIDGSEIISSSLYTTCYTEFVDASNYAVGVCCEPPTPAPLESCLGNQECVSTGQCAAQGSANYNPQSTTLCYLPGTTLTGECCDRPSTIAPTLPPTPAPLITCPGTQECVDSTLCKADGTINTDGASLINLRSKHTTCYIDVNTYTTGVCCQPPAPVTPAPLVTCSGNKICISQEQCTSQSAVSVSGTPSYTSCILDADTYATGVCCDPPIRNVDTCPGDSVCTPEILCQGKILDNNDQYVQYDSTGTWTQCSLGDTQGLPGVCCIHPPTTTTVAPQTTASSYTAADKCGVRNYGLDVRTPVTLAKNEAQFAEFPWQAIIFFTNFTFKCGASIINDNWLLTAAHCVHGYQYGDFKVRLGDWQVNKYDEPLPYEDVDVASIIIHPDFKPGPVHNDIALIKLAKPLTLKYHINSICLPNYEQVPNPGTRCFASGWGKNAFEGNYQAILKKIDVPVVEKNYCQALLRKTRLGKYFVLDKSFMCAGGEKLVDACEGDGGGPLSCQDETTGRYYIAGITAWGIGCGEEDVPGVYVDVQLFRPWIDGIIQEIPQQQQQQQQQEQQQQPHQEQQEEPLSPSGYGRK